MAAWKLAPAICAGCTTVLKPAEQTPLSVLALASELRGRRPAAGRRQHRDRATGPTGRRDRRTCRTWTRSRSPAAPRSARRSCAAAADTLKKISLELGGKSPNIFFADADFEAAVEGALFGVFFNQGEVCSAGSRILVQRPIYKRFVDAMVEKAKRDHGSARRLDRDTKMGPLVSREQFDRVRRYQEIGKQEAKLALAAARASGGALDRGYFIEPTIFYDVDNSARIAREEIFGPVACVIPFDAEEDALRIANDTLLRPGGRGLDARHLPRHAMPSRRSRAGIVWVNHMQPTYVEAPWGGYKQSGIGRELGKWGVDEYLNVKQVYINLSEEPIGWY